ncbi:MAG TPA: hypothetical protein VNK48_14465 [Xanthobacteraceae bacterium]|nr:hypothetical protein [Xanthobacteraceae bacterium]
MLESGEADALVDRALDEGLEAAAEVADAYHAAFVRIFADDPGALKVRDVIAAFRLLAADIRAAKSRREARR